MAVERKKETKCEKGAAAWLLTYGDMTTLLLTFFILMFTTAEIDGYELKLILSSFSGSFGIMEGGLTLQKGPLAEMGMTVEKLPSTKSAEKLNKAFKIHQNMFKPETTSRRIRITEDYRGFVISIPGKVYFQPDSSKISQEGKQLLEKIALLIIKIKSETAEDHQVEIEGHSSLEPNSVKEKDLGLSNIWEKNLDLSTSRAVAVEKIFINKFREQRIKPVIKKNGREIAKFVIKGYGEFEPYESNDSPEERAWNRRVDVVIKRD